MRPLRYGINVTLDGCVDHTAGLVNEELHAHWAETLASGDALLYGRVTYEMMEAGWRHPVPPGTRPAWMEPFVRVINGMRKHVVSRTLAAPDWNAELVAGDLEAAVRALKARPGGRILTGGVRLPLALAELGLIDEFEFVVHPRVAGRGPTLLAGLSRITPLELVEQRAFRCGAELRRYVPAA